MANLRRGRQVACTWNLKGVESELEWGVVAFADFAPADFEFVVALKMQLKSDAA